MSALRVTGLGGTGEPDLAANQSTRRPSELSLGTRPGRGSVLADRIVEGQPSCGSCPAMARGMSCSLTSEQVGPPSHSDSHRCPSCRPCSGDGMAAGTAGLLAELISSKRRSGGARARAGPRALSFRLRTGTDSWRVPGLAAMAGSACWYLVAVVGQRERDQGSSSLRPTRPQRRRAHHVPPRRCVPLWMAALAAFSAAALGPNLPGARSVALVAWHGTGGAGNGGAKLSPGATASGVQVSTLVQVAQQEVDDPSVALFTVHSRTAHGR